MNEVKLERGPFCRKDLLSALAGKQAGKERAIADRTRRVVLTSLGVLREQKVDRKRQSSLALVALVLFLVFLGPFLWKLTDELIGGELIGDYTVQITLGAVAVSSATLAAMLIAGQLRRRL